MHQHATRKELGLVPILVTSPFLPLSPQIASAWRMMSQYWCQHHSPGAWEPRSVMYSWVPSESSIGLYNKEPRSTYRVAVARPLCQLIHYSYMSFSVVCGPHHQLQMRQSEMKLSAWTCGLRHFRKSAYLYNIPDTKHNFTDCYRAG